MTNPLRFRSGQVELHRFRVDSETVIQAGDMVYVASGKVKPASDFPWTTDLATTQAGFAAVFVGVAHQSSAAGESSDISVDISPLAIYETAVDAATFEVGSFLAPDNLSETLMSQQLMKVTAAEQAIARSAEYKTSASSSLRVMMASALHVASANVNAALG